MPPPIFRKYRKNNLDFFMLDYLVQLKHVWQPWYRRWSRKGVKVNMLKSADSGVGIMGVARGGQRSRAPARFLEKTVIFCFERRFSTQNSVIRLKSNILAPPQIFGLTTPLPRGIYLPIWKGTFKVINGRENLCIYYLFPCSFTCISEYNFQNHYMLIAKLINFETWKRHLPLPF